MCDKCDVKNKCNCKCYKEWQGWYNDLSGNKVTYCEMCEHKIISATEKNNRCLGCGKEIVTGEICYHCLYDGLTITFIHSKTGKTRVKGCDGKEYVIWSD